MRIFDAQNTATRNSFYILFGLLFFIATFQGVAAKKNAIPTPSHKPGTEKSDVTVTIIPPSQIDSLALPDTTSSTQKPLNQHEIALYREIFDFQSQGDWINASALIQKIDNPILMGHVKAQRILHPQTQTTDEALKNWLVHYADHPQAPLIAKKLGQPNLSEYRQRLNGTLDDLRHFANGSRYISARYKSGQLYEVNQIRRKIKDYLEKGAASTALNFFNGHRAQSYIDPVDRSQILADIASVYLYLGHPEKAQKTAGLALKTSSKTPVSGWILGLTAYINSDFAKSARYFEIASKAEYASPWMTSAAAYWSARAYTKAKNYAPVKDLLFQAMKYQRSFYGLLATKALGAGYEFNWKMPTYTPAMKDQLMSLKAGARAIALANVGRLTMAQAEILSIDVRNQIALRETLIAFAHHYNLAGYAMRFASALPNPAGGYYDSGLFPISSWTQKTDYTADKKALLNAFIRQESRFIPTAQNATGATGLMQIMPSTAAFITENGDYKNGTEGRQKLAIPAKNIEIGAQYLDHLMALNTVDNDLFALTIAYNAGPGKLKRWQEEIMVNDPLLFIEMIPASETRAFIERVVTNFWVYQMQMGIEPKTLSAVAKGAWPVLK